MILPKGYTIKSFRDGKMWTVEGRNGYTVSFGDDKNNVIKEAAYLIEECKSKILFGERKEIPSWFVRMSMSSG